MKNNKNLALAVLALALVIIALITVNWKLDRAGKKSLEEEKAVLPSPVYQKGIPQKAAVPSAKAGEVIVVNAPEVKKKLVWDDSTAYRKVFKEVIEETLKEMGYALTIYNRASLTDEFTIPTSNNPPGAQTSGCSRFGFRWDSNKGMIEVFYLMDLEDQPCTQDKLMVPLINAVGQANGQVFEWWKKGLAKANEEQGRKPDPADFPLTVIE